MASLAVHRTASVGSIVKKMLDINPDLGITELSAIIRSCTRKRGGLSNEYADVEVVDEQMALRLARETLSEASATRR